MKFIEGEFPTPELEVSEGSKLVYLFDFMLNQSMIQYRIKFNNEIFTGCLKSGDYLVEVPQEAQCITFSLR